METHHCTVTREELKSQAPPDVTVMTETQSFSGEMLMTQEEGMQKYRQSDCRPVCLCVFVWLLLPQVKESLLRRYR